MMVSRMSCRYKLLTSKQQQQPPRTTNRLDEEEKTCVVDDAGGRRRTDEVAGRAGAAASLAFFGWAFIFLHQCIIGNPQGRQKQHVYVFTQWRSL